jgi:hypothetical protein
VAIFIHSCSNCTGINYFPLYSIKYSPYKLFLNKVVDINHIYISSYLFTEPALTICHNVQWFAMQHSSTPLKLPFISSQPTAAMSYSYVKMSHKTSWSYQLFNSCARTSHEKTRNINMKNREINLLTICG